VIQTCSYCGKSFTSYYIAKIPYCSKECKKESTRRICEECGKVYYPRQQRANTRFCSRECLDIYRHRKSIESRTRICETCGKEFIMRGMSGKSNRGEVNEGRFCSKKCYGEWLSLTRTKTGPSCIVYFVACDICGKLFTARSKATRLCSDECKAEESRQRSYKIDSTKKALSERKCKQCGKLFTPEYGDKRRSYCSDICLRRNTKDSRKARIKAKDNGVYYEYVNPMKVFKRDGWRCQLCGKKLSPKHRGTYRDDAPELDHIIPWVQGGEHSYRNTQLACRKCNGEKGAQEIGQLRLFG